MTDETTATDEEVKSEVETETESRDDQTQAEESVTLDVEAIDEYESRIEELNAQLDEREAIIEQLKETVEKQEEQLSRLDSRFQNLSARVADGRNFGVCPDCDGPTERKNGCSAATLSSATSVARSCTRTTNERFGSSRHRRSTGVRIRRHLRVGSACRVVTRTDCCDSFRDHVRRDQTIRAVTTPSPTTSVPVSVWSATPSSSPALTRTSAALPKKMLEMRRCAHSTSVETLKPMGTPSTVVIR